LSLGFELPLPFFELSLESGELDVLNVLCTGHFDDVVELHCGVVGFFRPNFLDLAGTDRSDTDGRVNAVWFGLRLRHRITSFGGDSFLVSTRTRGRAPGSCPSARRRKSQRAAVAVLTCVREGRNLPTQFFNLRGSFF
jgi:hypothetical protein